MKVTKRDGRIVEFNSEKIVSVIEAAMKETEAGVDPALSRSIADRIAQAEEDMTVERIQDLVEDHLMASNRKDVARKYILYRAERTRQRDMNGEIIRQVSEKTNATVVKNANANVDERSFGGRKNEAASALQKIIALDKNMSPDAAKAHKDGWLYHHDLDSWNIGMHNCLFLNFRRLFTNGFSTRNGDVRPPKSFSTACQQMAVAFQIQSQSQYGGVGSVHADTDLAPFVALSFERHFKDGLKYIGYDDQNDVAWWKKLLVRAGLMKPRTNSPVSDIRIDNDKLLTRYPGAYQYAMDMLEREGKQAAQGLYHNLNTLESRAGSQVPFTSLNLGRDTSTEGRLVTRWLLEASIEGIGKNHSTSIFPISIFSAKKGVNMNPGEPNYDLKRLAMKSLSQRIYPNFCFGDFTEAHEDPDKPDTIFATMGCRTMIGYDRHGLGYCRVGRGNNNPITIILPKLGIEYGICRGERTEPDLDGFWKKLDELLHLAENAHLERYAILAKQSPKAAPFMYDNGTIADADMCVSEVHEALKHNTFAFGYLGIAEMCEALFGENHVHNQDAHRFALSVVQRIHDFAAEFSQRYNLNGSCYATPAENLAHTAMLKLQSQYGTIPNVTDREYLTNSHHVPVWEKVYAFEKLQIEAPFCKLATGGTITYIECESTFMQNLDAVEAIIDYACDLNIPYLAFNFPIDTCEDCGYQSEFDAECPECGSRNIISLRRVTGYLTSDYRRFNDGKQAEVRDRVKHTSSYQYTKE